MQLVTPQLGLFFWTLVIFLGLFFILRAFAWKPILAALREREESIANSLAQAEKARAEMASLTAQNEQLLNQARAERAEILAEANRTKDKIIAEAREAASVEQGKKVAEAEAAIHNAKNAALTEIKNTAGQLAIDIAERILRRELKSDSEQQRLVAELVKEFQVPANSN